VFSQLQENEQNIFSFLLQYVLLINELQMVFGYVNKVLQHLKNNGLSHATAEFCQYYVQELRASAYPRVRAVGDALADYINREKMKLPDANSVHHISSDIIESLFGYFKRIKSPNPMNGVTTRVFCLPLQIQMSTKTGMEKISFKTCLENVRMVDLQKWRKTHLPKNKVVKRIKLLKSQQPT
jgi:hypothetical protein